MIWLHPANRFPRFTPLAEYAEAIIVPCWLARLLVNPDQFDYEVGLQSRWNATDGTGFAFTIVERQHAFGGRIVL